MNKLLFPWERWVVDGRGGGEWEGVVATDWALVRTDVYSLYWLCREGSVLILESSTFIRNRTESLKVSALEGLGNILL